MKLTPDEELQINADQSSRKCIFCHASELKWLSPDKTSLRVMPTKQGVIKQTIVAGDPEKSGWLTMRMDIPPNYHVPPHHHPHAEHGTLLRGTYYMCLGDKFDKNGANVAVLKAGDYFVIPVNTPHFAWTNEDGVLFQLDLIGPYKVILC